MQRFWRIAAVGLSLGVVLLLLSASFATSQPPTLRIAAAISLKDALEAIGKMYKSESGHAVEFTFGSSGEVAAQIERGAEIDVFISAASAPMLRLLDGEHVAAADVQTVATNTLVLVSGSSGPDIRSFDDLAGEAIRRIGCGEPRSVPAGMYGLQVLEHLNLTPRIRGKLIYGTNVRQVLDFVRRGDVQAGLVYRTDVSELRGGVRVVAEALPGWHDPIEYPAAVVAASRQRSSAKEFLAYLKSDAALAELRRRGFGPVGAGHE